MQDCRMRYSISNEQRAYFERETFIELEGLLTDKQLIAINTGIKDALTKKLKAGENTPNDLFMAGRDLWRENESVQKIVLSSQFGTLAGQLLDQKSLRIGCDQLFPPPTKSNSTYDILVQRRHLLDELFSFQGIACGLMLALEDQPGTTFGILPSKAGNGVYFLPNCPIDLALLSRPCLMIIYLQPSSAYYFKAADPLSHAMKKLGYSTGSQLQDKTHPIVYRI